MLETSIHLSILQDRFWINDAAMVLFFFLVGMEIKRELVVGELASIRRMAVPAAAATGGMVVPALIFFLIVLICSLHTHL